MTSMTGEFSFRTDSEIDCAQRKLIESIWPTNLYLSYIELFFIYFFSATFRLIFISSFNQNLFLFFLKLKKTKCHFHYFAHDSIFKIKLHCISFDDAMNVEP